MKTIDVAAAVGSQHLMEVSIFVLILFWREAVSRRYRGIGQDLEPELGENGIARASKI